MSTNLKDMIPATGWAVVQGPAARATGEGYLGGLADHATGRGTVVTYAATDTVVPFVVAGDTLYYNRDGCRPVPGANNAWFVPEGSFLARLEEGD
jgi:hypothetical protein